MILVILFYHFFLFVSAMYSYTYPQQPVQAVYSPPHGYTSGHHQPPSIGFDFNNVTPYSAPPPSGYPGQYPMQAPYAPYGPAPPPAAYPGYSTAIYPAASQSHYASPPLVAMPAPAIYTAPGIHSVSHYHLPVGGQSYIFQFKGHRLDRKDVFSQSDPFLLISASREGLSKLKKNANKMAKQAKTKKRFEKVRGKWTTVYRSETVRNDQNPTWRPFTVSLQTLCRNNLDIPFLIECWDADRSGNHDFIGRIVTTLRELQVMREVQLINKRRFGIGSVSGMLEVLQCHPA